jgi:predicted CXXCH cytochrome family protein
MHIHLRAPKASELSALVLVAEKELCYHLSMLPGRDRRSRFVKVWALPILLAAVLLPGTVRAEPCLDCHDKTTIGTGDRSTHTPFADDDCTSCHADHGDQETLVLARGGNALCTECHDPDDDTLSSAHRNIRGEKASCLSCHDPHRSAQEHLLREGRHRPLAFGRCDQCHRYDGRLVKSSVKELCLSCHGGEKFSRRIVHGPVRSGECLACHDPHASREPALLKSRYAPGRFATGEGDVALCLGCHEAEAYFSDSTDGTLFRDGGRNYHALHLAPSSAARQERPADRALSCRSCHEVHSSEGSRLVRREMDCGGVPCLRLEYRRSDTGGECLSGCHTPQAYTFIGRVELVPVPASPAAAAPDRSTLEPSALERSINKRCVACHEKDVKRFAKRHIHAPTRSGFCSACHLDHGPENRLLLLGPEDRVCSRCHDLRDARIGAAHQGFPIAGSRCSECHDPHAGENAAYLYPRRHAPFAEGDCAACHGKPAAGWRIPGEGNATCAGCHDDVGRENHLHEAIRQQGCTGCHRPHASAEARLLRAPSARLCFSCHSRAPFLKETTHPPAEEGDCAACHQPHGSANLRLLARPYPLEQFVPFAAERYGLCWECHDEGAITDPARVGDTGFSNGKRNLHAVHLADRATQTEVGRRVQPGISCRNCHDPHATEGPNLIRRVLDCNGVPCLQVEFRKVGKGGRCVGGCHQTASYVGSR